MPKYLIDKYTPKNIADALGTDIDALKQLYGDRYYDWRWFGKPYFHRKLLTDLKTISQNDDLPHIIFYGASGTGKNTITNLFLEMIFGNAVYAQEFAKYPVQNATSQEEFVEIKQSMHHIIIEPNNNNSDRQLVQDVIKTYASSCPLRFSEESKTFKVVQINNLDDLTRNVQTSLRCTIENYSKTCRFIMSCNSLSKVIPPLRSRCVCIHVPVIPEIELIDWLNRIALEENIEIDLATVINIVDSSSQNLKDILWKLELYRRKGTIKNSYQQLLSTLNKQMVLDYDIMEIRDTIYAIYTSNKIMHTFIVDFMNMMLKKVTDMEIAKQIVAISSKYEHRLSLARHDVMQLEAFVVMLLRILFFNDKNK
jgi:replication factor C subunit 3/5